MARSTASAGTPPSISNLREIRRNLRGGVSARVPVKVTRSAVQNAVSIAGLLLTTEALVTDIPEEKGAAPPMPGGGMGMDF